MRFIFPLLATLLGVVAIVLFFWLMTQFICELHGFEQPMNVFGMIIVSMVGIIFGVALLAAIASAILGVEAPNV